jgi:hypothetical protein
MQRARQYTWDAAAASLAATWLDPGGLAERVA